jgi:hypothetical protein
VSDYSKPASTILRDLAPVDRGLFGTLRDLFVSPGRATRDWLANPETARPTPMQVYLAAAGISFGVTSFISEADTGALYVFGGGVFGKLGQLGAWIAFLTAVPVLAGSLRIAFARAGATLRSELAFALHFEAIVLLGIALESIVLYLLPESLPVRGAASWLFLLVVAVYYYLALIEYHRQSLAETVARGSLAIVSYATVFTAAVVALATLIGFRL